MSIKVAALYLVGIGVMMVGIGLNQNYMITGLCVVAAIILSWFFYKEFEGRM